MATPTNPIKRTTTKNCQPTPRGFSDVRQKGVRTEEEDIIPGKCVEKYHEGSRYQAGTHWFLYFLFLDKPEHSLKEPNEKIKYQR